MAEIKWLGQVAARQTASINTETTGSKAFPIVAFNGRHSLSIQYPMKISAYHSWLLVFFSCIGFPAVSIGQERLDIPACPAHIHPVECYTSSSDLAVAYSELLSKLAVNDYKLGSILYDAMLARMTDNSKRYRDKIEPRYEAAAKFLAANREGLNLLKDYHAVWLSTMNSLHQRPNETETGFARRVAERKAVLEDKKNRLLLEK